MLLKETITKESSIFKIVCYFVSLQTLDLFAFIYTYMICKNTNNEWYCHFVMQKLGPSFKSYQIHWILTIVLEIVQKETKKENYIFKIVPDSLNFDNSSGYSPKGNNKKVKLLVLKSKVGHFWSDRLFWPLLVRFG